MKCKYDNVVSHEENMTNIKKKSKESYAEHINRLLDEYDDEDKA